MIKNLFRLVHSVIIVYIIVKILDCQIITKQLIIAQAAISLVRSLHQWNLFSRRTKCQLVATSSLLYMLFPNQTYSLCWIFFIKGIQVHQSLKAFRKQFYNQTSNKYITFLFDTIRFGISQYIFYGFIMVIYKFTTHSPQQPFPENYVVMYQLAVTGATIGYGDVIPQTKSRMMFFTYAIPLLVGSFIILVSNLVDIYTKTFLKEDEIIIESEKVKGK